MCGKFFRENLGLLKTWWNDFISMYKLKAEI